MVYFMENPIKTDDLGGPPLFLETPTTWGSTWVILTSIMRFHPPIVGGNPGSHGARERAFVGSLERRGEDFGPVNWGEEKTWYLI